MGDEKAWLLQILERTRWSVDRLRNELAKRECDIPISTLKFILYRNVESQKWYYDMYKAVAQINRELDKVFGG